MIKSDRYGISGTLILNGKKPTHIYYLENGQYQLGGIYDKTPAQSVIFEGFEAVLEKIFR